MSEVERDEIYSNDLAQVEIPNYIWNNVEKTKTVLIQNTHRKVSARLTSKHNLETPLLTWKHDHELSSTTLVDLYLEVVYKSKL